MTRSAGGVTGESIKICILLVANLYFASDSQEQADAMYRENDRGLCADCPATTILFPEELITKRDIEEP